MGFVDVDSNTKTDVLLTQNFPFLANKNPSVNCNFLFFSKVQVDDTSLRMTLELNSCVYHGG